MTIRLRYCEIDMRPWGCVVRFEDGTEAKAIPHETPHYHIIAARSGFPDDVLGYCQSHELCHALCEEVLYDRPSRVLWGVAHGKMLSGRDAVYEELAAQAAQRWVWANELPVVGGCDWSAFKARALELWGGQHSA